MKNNKTLFMALIICSCFFITACNNTNHKETVDTELTEKDDMFLSWSDNVGTKSTETNCYLTGIKDENKAETGLSNISKNTIVYYNTLDDSESYYHTNDIYYFDTWEQAKKYYDNNEEIKKFKNNVGDVELSEESLDTDGVFTITVSNYHLEQTKIKDFILNKKNEGYSCHSSSNELKVN